MYSSATKPIKHLIRNLKRLLSFTWQMDKRLVLGYYGTAVISAVLRILGIFTITYLIDALIVQNNQSLTTSIPLIVVIILASRYVLNVLANITNWIINQSYYDYLMRYKLQNQIAYTFYTKLTSLDMAQLEDPKIQDLISKAKDTMLWRPTDTLRHFCYFLSGFVSLVVTFIALLPFSWWIPLVVSISTVPFLYLRAKYGSAQWSIYGSGAPETKKLWHFMWLFSTPTSIREMKIFASSDALLNKYKRTQDHLFAQNKKPLDAYMRILTLPPLFEAIILFTIIYLQLPDVLSGAITVGAFTLLVNLVDNLNGQVSSVVVNTGEMYSHSLYVDHYFDVLALPKTIKESDKPHVFEKITPPKIEFKNVSFAYPNGQAVINNISFVIEPGENIALVGENGAGKSTIIKLLCRFYDVTEGEILINGVNIKQLKLSQWYQFLGTLFQDFVQYHFTVRENIALGNPDKHDEGAIKEAAVKSGAYAFIKDLPKGFDTVLGREFENGVELSIGQWQKLAIARAFYEEAPVLILDEPTSAIDAEAEFEIFDNLLKTYKKKSLLLVSHRFSTVRNADKIFVVDHGEITEQGTHEELLKQNGKYARMFTTQAKGYQ